MRLPKSVKVGDTVYAVQAVRALADDDGKPLHGLALHDECRLKINADDSAERQRWALIHELAHAVFHESGMGHEMSALIGAERADALEEDIVRRVVPELLRALKDAKVIR